LGSNKCLEFGQLNNNTDATGLVKGSAINSGIGLGKVEGSGQLLVRLQAKTSNFLGKKFVVVAQIELLRITNKLISIMKGSNDSIFVKKL
jgi:hypothetical protein